MKGDERVTGDAKMQLLSHCHIICLLSLNVITHSVSFFSHTAHGLKKSFVRPNNY
ncbi:hypothetical protein HanRHA438_Chr01g0012081 [Helianthus annuus]|nr:hypothetical protein HanRHA438_Chr01g0012081 [Helianthus annuus]